MRNDTFGLLELVRTCMPTPVNSANRQKMFVEQQFYESTILPKQCDALATLNQRERKPGELGERELMGEGCGKMPPTGR